MDKIEEMECNFEDEDRTLCKCGKEYSNNDKEHGMCHKCWAEIKEVFDLAEKIIN